jgi:hypothetical protein
MLVILLLIQKIDEKFLEVVKNYTDKNELVMPEYETEDRQLELVEVLHSDQEMKETTQKI